jgi:hypothetical protein
VTVRGIHTLDAPGYCLGSNLPNSQRGSRREVQWRVIDTGAMVDVDAPDNVAP